MQRFNSSEECCTKLTAIVLTSTPGLREENLLIPSGSPAVGAAQTVMAHLVLKCSGNGNVTLELSMRSHTVAGAICALLLVSATNAWSHDDDDDRNDDEREVPATPAEIRAELRNSLRGHARDSIQASLTLRCLSDSRLQDDDSPLSGEEASRIEACAERSQARMLKLRNEYNRVVGVNAISVGGVRQIVREFIAEHQSRDDEPIADLPEE
jgi:hypothetical protein